MSKKVLSKADIERIAQEKNVKFVRLQFTDILGIIKNVEIPVSQLPKALDNKMMFDGSSIEGFVRIEESDMYLKPDLSTWVIFPWGAENGRVARLICDIIHPDGRAFEGDPRSNLRRVLKEMEALGFSDFNLGPEPEFFLFKLVVKTSAAKHGLHATFMAKPIYGINGSGMHCNVSLFKNGENSFFDPKGQFELSETAYQFIAGVLKYVPYFTAVTNPTVNSYKRLVPGYEAPCYVAWSPKNRSPLIRIPAARGMSTRVEVRSVDPSTNPYLAMAVVLKAGLEGIKQKLKAPAPVDRNIYVMSKEERVANGIIDLPSNLHEALKNLKSEPLMIDALGTHIFERFVEAKEIEWDMFRTTVTEWELQQYLRVY